MENKKKKDDKTAKTLEKLERKAILEAEKRKKPGECLKVYFFVFSIISIFSCFEKIFIIFGNHPFSVCSSDN